MCAASLQTEGSNGYKNCCIVWLYPAVEDKLLTFLSLNIVNYNIRMIIIPLGGSSLPYYLLSLGLFWKKDEGKAGWIKDLLLGQGMSSKLSLSKELWSLTCKSLRARDSRQDPGCSNLGAVLLWWGEISQAFSRLRRNESPLSLLCLSHIFLDQPLLGLQSKKTEGWELSVAWGQAARKGLGLLVTSLPLPGLKVPSKPSSLAPKGS